MHLGSGTPVVWAGDYVHVDMTAGARLGIRHLIGIGCRRIAYVCPSFLATPRLGHYDAFVETVTGAGLTSELIAHDEWELPAVRRVTREYIERNAPPDGIFCHNDELAIALFRGFRDCGLPVPEDVAIIGCEGDEFLEYFDPPPSSVVMPIAEMCRVGWETLSRRIVAPDEPARHLETAVRVYAAGVGAALNKARWMGDV